MASSAMDVTAGTLVSTLALGYWFAEVYPSGER
jgi:hypothetical protein